MCRNTLQFRRFGAQPIREIVSKQRINHIGMYLAWLIVEEHGVRHPEERRPAPLASLDDAEQARRAHRGRTAGGKPMKTALSRAASFASLALVVLLLAHPRPAVATALFPFEIEARERFTLFFQGRAPNNTTVPVSVSNSGFSVCGTDPFFFFVNCRVDASAGININVGLLGTRANASAFNLASGGNVNSSAKGVAGWVIDDLIFEGPDSTVEVQLNLGFIGDLEVPATGGGGATATWFVDGLISGPSTSFRFGGQRRVESNFPETGDGILAFVSAAELAGGFQFVSDPFSVTTGVPLTFSLTTRSNAFTSIQTGQEADALSDFINTLSLPLTGPVFVLPGGFTANSPSLGSSTTPGSVPCPYLASPNPPPSCSWALA